MKVDDFNKNVEGGLASVSATVTWEDADRPERRIYIKTDAQFADDLDCNPNAFLLAAVIPAMYHGERRVLVEGKVCPQLRNGLVTAMQILRRWYGEAKHCPVKIEATEGFEPPLPRSPQRAASFLSGGVDSLATLYANRLDFPLDHPGSIQDCFFVHGFDVGGYEHLNKNRENFDMAVASLSELASDAKVTLIPVYTNLRYLEDDDAGPYNNRIFTMESHGASLAAIAHAFSRRVTRAMIASSYNIEELAPWGSHPLLDPNYSSAAVCIQHDGARLSRFEKVGLIAEWDAALKTLRACLDTLRPDDVMNCGQCEKCLRTMTELLVFGKLRQCRTYPLDDISPDQVQTLKVRLNGIDDSPLTILTAGTAYHWRHLVAPLKRIGRHDLVKAIEAKLAEYEKYRAQMEWKNRVRRFDRKRLGGVLSKLNRLRFAGKH
jgi:hypothetical protein